MRKSIWFLAPVLVVLAAGVAVVLSKGPAANVATGPAAARASLGLINPQEIRFVTNAIYPPMEFVDPNTGVLSGFDIDLGDAIAHKMGLKASWSKVSFAQLLSSLQTRRGDAILSGMRDDVKRRGSMDIVDYLLSAPTVFTLSTKASLYNATSDFCGRKVAGSRSTSVSGVMAKWSDENCVAKGKPAIIFEGTDDSNAARLGLKQGRFEGVVQGVESISYQIRVEPDTYKIVGGSLTTTDFMGIGVRKSDPRLRAALVKALNDLIRSGEYEKLLKKWDLYRNAIPAITVNGLK